METLINVKLKLYEIIEANEEISTTILAEEILRRKKQVYRYYKRLYCCEPVLMITNVMNAAQYCKIVPANEFSEYLQDYVDTLNVDFEGKEYALEEINLNSILLKELT